MKIKHSLNFSLEFRKEKGILIQKNIPINAEITWTGKRLRYYTGHRVNRDQWINVLPDGEKIQRVKKNNFNKAGISASDINKELINIESVVKSIFEYFGGIEQIPTVKQVRQEIKERLNKFKDQDRTNNLFSCFELYCKEAEVSDKRRSHLYTVLNHLKRFNQKLTFDNSTYEAIASFERYLKTDYKTDETLEPKSQNTIIGILKKLRTFFKYAIKKGWTSKTPFVNYKIESEVYGDPIYITKEERDLLYTADIPEKRLARVRDIFVLQCFLGCRIGDFVKLTHDNIINGSVQYIQSKTKNKQPNVLGIPLTKKAQSIIDRYDLPDKSLVPFISDVKYNEYLKELFEYIGLKRKVIRLNPLTRQKEVVRLCDIVSSHMARRTFIGLLHKTVKNEVIASMSGHVENSKAFARYYSVDDELRKEAIKEIE
jgi:integrase